MHSFSLPFGLYNELGSGKVRNFAEFFAELSQYVRTCLNSPWLWTENRRSTQIGEILASVVEARNFVDLKLGDLSTVPCLIVCNCNIRICSNLQRSTAKSSISNAIPFFIICVIVCNCNIRICPTSERSTAKSRLISNTFSFLIILKPVRKIWIIWMRSCFYPNLICFLLSFSSEHDMSL